jgi:hypothetical protein
VQELALYHALLSDLTDAELVEVIGREMRRRKRISIVLSAEAGHVLSCVCWPIEWGSLADEPLVEQLKIVAAWVGLAGTTAEMNRAIPDEGTIGD